MGDNPTAGGVDAAPQPLAPDAPRPASLRRAALLVGVLVLLGAVLTVLAVVFEDELVRATGGAGASADDTRVPASFGPVVVVLDVVLTSLVLVLTALLLAGHGWARHSLAVALGVVAIGTVSGLTTGSVPLVVVLAGVLVLLVEAAVLALLYRPDAGAWLGRPPEA